MPPYLARETHASVVEAALRVNAAVFARLLAPSRELVRALLDAPAFSDGSTLRARLVDGVRAVCARGESRLRALFTEYAHSATVDMLESGAHYLARDEHAVPTRDAVSARRAVSALVRNDAYVREVLVTSVRALLGTYDVYVDDADERSALLVVDWTEHAHRIVAVAV